jgi:hypothetical protein
MTLRERSRSSQTKTAAKNDHKNVRIRDLIAYKKNLATNDITMATTEGGDQINIDANGHGNDHDDHDDNNDDNDGTAMTGRATTGGTTGGSGPTSFNLRVEQNKIPEFFGAKSKNTISAADFIR